MGRNGIVYSALLMVIFAMPSQSFGQGRLSNAFSRVPTAPIKANPIGSDVVTIWQKLGFPQGAERIRSFRDSRINKDGLSPGKERKPKLLSLADPAFLAEDAPPLLNLAAKMKIDQDLAPQKIKALMYICSVGCSCYNKQSAGLVEKALIEAMKDCTLEVRLAAMNVILSNAGDKCACNGQCATCCTDGIMKALKEIAYKQDKRGCYLETNAQVRAMAERALNACPPVIEEPEEVAEDASDSKESASDSEDGEDEDLEGSEDGENDPPGPEEDAPTKADADGEDDQASNRRRKTPAKQVSTTKSFGTAWNDPALNELNIRGFINAQSDFDSNITVKLLRPLELPTGSQVVVASDENNVSFGTVLSSKSGEVTLRVEDYLVVRELKSQERVRVGVLE